ncbi:hypothetical protein Tco_0817916 [Tanacetum coccineum]
MKCPTSPGALIQDRRLAIFSCNYVRKLIPIERTSTALKTSERNHTPIYSSRETRSVGSPAIERLGSQSEWVASSREEQRNKNDQDTEGLEDDGLGLEEEEAVPKGQQQAVPVVETVTNEPLGLGYGALRRRELAVGEDQVPSTFEVGQSSSLCTTSCTCSSHVVPSPIASPRAIPTATISVDEDHFIEVGAQLELHGSILQDHTQRLDALPPTLVTDIDKDVSEMYTRSGAVKDEIFCKVLALEAWARHVDTRLADMSRARYDDNRLIHDMLVQQAVMQRELQEMRGRVTVLKQEMSHREQ